MRSLTSFSIPVAALALGLLGTTFTACTAKNDFKSLFNGKDLTGWDGLKEYWTVRDGAITGQTTAEKKLPANTFLVWKGGEPKNFELRISFKLTADTEQKSANSGIQIRSKVLDAEKFVVAGYQADMDLAGRYIGMFYEEKGRGIMMKPGEKIKITTAPAGAAPVEGAKGPPKAHAVEVLGTVSSPEQVKAAYKVGEWNDFVIIANGNHFQQFINGVPTADALDLDEPRFAKSGVIALQLHTGPPMTIQFKNIQLKTLP